MMYVTFKPGSWLCHALFFNVSFVFTLKSVPCERDSSLSDITACEVVL